MATSTRTISVRTRRRRRPRSTCSTRTRIGRSRTRYRRNGRGKMVMTRVLAIVAAAGLLGACDRPLSTPEKGAVLGGAAGTGIGLVTGGSFGQVVGAGLI